MYILGINGGFRQGYQDVATVLIKDGAVIAAVEEERLSRIKFSAGKLPYLSIKEILRIGNISIQDIDEIAFHGSTWTPNFSSKLKQYFIQHFGHSPKISLHHHHNCHAASAYYDSGFKEALILTIDGSGDGISIQVAIGKNGKLKTIYRAARPNSLGIFYSLITQYCGFTKDSDEYKLMGLSSYGNRNAFDFSWLIDYEKGKIKINTKYLIQIKANQSSAHRDEMLFNTLFEKKLKQAKRLPTEKVTNFYKDIAASAQQHIENLILKILEYYVDETKVKNIALAGGVALNCVANQKIVASNFVENIFVQPASSDAGIALGAAWLSSIKNNIQPIQNKNVYLGGNYTNIEIEKILKSCKIKYTKINNITKYTAHLIASNKVVAWFQDRMEFGPRALGNRSILANATNPNIQAIVNEKIKLREGFRPFCPSVLEEDVLKYFETKIPILPYMTITTNTTNYAKKNIRGVIHVDGTARIQTVNKQQNKKYYNLLNELKQITGHGVVLNTSFNLSHEPIVCTPRDALATFFSSGLDVLIIENFVIEKV